MPRKPSVTKEEIQGAAFQLVRREGANALTARNLAAELGCSTQPIMYRFPDLSELYELVYQRADEYHTAYILAVDSFMETGLRYVRFASEEPYLFRLLFQSGHFDGKTLVELINAPETEPVLSAAASEMGLSREDVASAFEIVFVAVHGYASLVANNAMPYDETAVERTLTAIHNGLLKGERS